MQAIAYPPRPMYSWGEGWGEGHLLSSEGALTLSLSPDYRAVPYVTWQSLANLEILSR
jgi:hypothetical protein